MKLLLIAEQGRGQMAARLYRHLHSCGIETRFVYQIGAVAAATLRAAGFVVDELPLRGRWDVQSIRCLRAVIRDFKPDIIHAWTAKTCFLAIAAQWPHKKAKIILERGALRRPHPLIPNDWLLFRSRWVDAYNCVCDAVGEFYAGCGIDRSRMLTTYQAFSPGGLQDGDPPPNLPPKGSRFRVGTIANYRKVKGLERLVDAADILQTRGVDFELLFVGRDDDDRLARYIAHASSRARITSLGWLAQPAPVLRTFDCVAIPSYSEGLTKLAFEALACGLPIVATRVGGMAEAVEHGVCGLLVPPNDPSALADAIQELAGNRPLQDRFRLNALRKFEAVFSFDPVCKSYERLYHQASER
jgi:glycosyltransferase involved in cell wall biosynthesis